MLTRKPRHTSSFSLECTDLKNVIFEKIPWAHSEDAEVAEVKWPRNPKFGLSDHQNDLLTSRTSEGAQWFFSKITFLKSVHSKEKDEVCHNFIVKIFTKSLHRGGVSYLYIFLKTEVMRYWTGLNYNWLVIIGSKVRRLLIDGDPCISYRLSIFCIT